MQQQPTDVGIILGTALVFYCLYMVCEAMARGIHRYRARRRFQRDLRAQKQAFQDAKSSVQDRLFAGLPVEQVLRKRDR